MVKINTNGNISKEEAQAYVDHLEKKHNRKLRELHIDIDGEDAILNYWFEPVQFERIRRVTGYLVGDMNRWNDGKSAEEKDRVKHDFGRTETLTGEN